MQIRPVHLPASHIQSDTFYAAVIWSNGDEVFDIRTIKIRALDIVRIFFCPVHLRRTIPATSTTPTASARGRSRCPEIIGKNDEI